MTLKGNGRCPNSRRSAGPPLRAQAMSAPEGQVEAVDQEILALLPIHRASGKRCAQRRHVAAGRSEEHTSELQSLMRTSYAVFCLKKKKKEKNSRHTYVHLTQTTTI